MFDCSYYGCGFKSHSQERIIYFSQLSYILVLEFFIYLFNTYIYNKITLDIFRTITFFFHVSSKMGSESNSAPKENRIYNRRGYSQAIGPLCHIGLLVLYNISSAESANVLNSYFFYFVFFYTIHQYNNIKKTDLHSMPNSIILQKI